MDFSLSNDKCTRLKRWRLINKMPEMEYRKETQHRRLESKKKISLPLESKAEDSLNTLRLTKDTSGHVRVSESPSKSCAESLLDGSGSEDSVVSGPSSPSAAQYSLRCRECERLFSKMRRQEPRKKKRDKNPASLSCDEWLLNKKWQPQRRQQSRGRLWVHLKRIRLRAAKQSDEGMTNKSWSLCSRPHVFLQRNLRHCKKLLRRASQSKAKPLHQRRNRAKPTSTLNSGNYPRRKKRKSTEDDTSEHLSISTSDLTVTSEDELPEKNTAHHEGLQKSEKVTKKQCVGDVSGLMDVQADCSGLEGTRRVLKFDSSLNDVLAVETLKTKHRLVLKNAEGKLHVGQADLTLKNGDCQKRLDDDLGEVSDAFRTPTDHCSDDLKITRKSRPSRPFGAQKYSFRTMLAALGHGHNQIIKESHH
ncbi:hypothetical protein KOW79_009328 [Hemibagrus wyckioides]|uniref:Uncharacterized protein n=1 Tax=Hemibagrus wyckioides TaxID=337641 RepID=A0A9D3NVP5_9TELE|nr:uncharacterized protein si:ch211-227n13.3 isoform X2 [Hemibagrus wyckioides]KAG7327722.1 hypothetical protein KOW79_009328 [Hemibagrus wyckioides]